MTPKQKRMVEHYLVPTLHVSEFGNEDSEVPADHMLKDFVCCYHERVRELHKGPFGDRVKPLLEAAVLRAGQADLEKLRQQDRDKRKTSA